MAGRLRGKVCVITGAGSGMGREAAILFTEEGASVCVADVDGAAAEQTAALCPGSFAQEVDVAAPTIATKLATLITDPPPRSRRWGMPCLQQRKTPFVFTACTRSQASTLVSSTEASSPGEMPALL